MPISMLSSGSKDTKAYFETESGKEIPCLFNPAQISMSLSAQWSDPPEDDDDDDDDEFVFSDDDEENQFKGTSRPTISFELMFDTTQAGKATPVTKFTEPLVNLTRKADVRGTSDAANDERPEWVRFRWGKFTTFKAVVTSLNINFVLFNKDGVPLRATASITLEQFEDDKKWPRQNPTSGTLAPARQHVVQPGETLDRIADTHFADPTDWRTLAEANGIRDPFAIRPGQRISVPKPSL
jgi:LysM repeat protein